MNYSSLIPVLKVVFITVVALIEVAPVRTGNRPVNEDPLKHNEVEREVTKVEDRGIGRAPKLRLLTTSLNLGDHGYSSKLHLNSE